MVSEATAGVPAAATTGFDLHHLGVLTGFANGMAKESDAHLSGGGHTR
jgi:hypothetical protein